MAQIVPYGSWPSPLSAAEVARGGIRLSGVAAGEAGVLWAEQRPAEAGRTVVTGPGGDRTPPGFNVRTAVHEYGGGAWWLHGSTVFFVHWDDQRLYRQDDGADPVPITPEPPRPRSLRYADGTMSPDGTTIVCVRERHEPGREPYNELVTLPADGSREPEVLVGGNDFYAFPRLSPDGGRLCWMEWSHPNLPWDGTTLFEAELRDGALVGTRTVAGSMSEAIFQPEWSPDGRLHFVSDRSGWWNLYRDTGGEPEPVLVVDGDLGVALWAFAMSTYTFTPDGTIVCALDRQAVQTLGVVRDGRFHDLGLGATSVNFVTAAGERVACVVESPTEAASVVAVDPSSGEVEVLKRSREAGLDEQDVSVPEAISYPSDGRTAHAFLYRPRNHAVTGPPGELPPLLVFIHGGPTGVTRPVLSPSIQYWTTRGFAVVDVNYGGSTGFGRDYRRLLNGEWGVVDVQDCVNAARYLAERGDVDPERLAIRGGSAGGFTTLAALAFTDVFKAGANHFGVADLETFVGDTHKFESRYLDTLVGPYPEQRQRYIERSPANAVERITAPLITFQGLEDAVVPPAQSERIVEALRAKRLPCAYVTYEGEQHGFRRAENIIHALESELYFYGRVFGFDPADEIAPVEIENL